MKIDLTPIDSLIPYARNPRKNQHAIAKVAASIKEFGFRQPIVADSEMVVIAGHTRLEAARMLELAQVPVHIAEGLTPAQVAAYRLADNRTGEDAEWDDELLAIEIGDLDGEIDLSITGFEDAELSALLAASTPVGLTNEDEIPEPPDEPITKIGDIWLLDRHKIICGDSLRLSNWESLDINKGSIVFTSPPYNLAENIKCRSKNASFKGTTYTEYSDNLSADDYEKMISCAISNGLKICSAAVFNVQPLAKSKRPLMSVLDKYSSNLVDVITWDKMNGQPAMASSVLTSRFEWLFILSSSENASRAVPFSSWRGTLSNVYCAPKQTDNSSALKHKATFPVHLPEYIITELMNKCRGVVDCFLGTGTTIIAAEKAGKVSYGIEITPSYVDVAVNRWQDFTGHKAIRESDGAEFDSLEPESVAA